MTAANLFDALRARFPDDRNQPLLEIPDGPAISYGDMEAASGRFATLLTELGARPGDRVAAQVDKSPEAVFLYLACARAGLIYLPLNPAYQQKELEYFLSDAEPAAVICQPQREAEFGEAIGRAGLGAKLLTLGADGGGSLTERARGRDPAPPTVQVRSDDIAAILYTSGTTGRSKGAMLSHDNLISNGDSLRRIWGFQPDDRLLHALPIFHTHGLFVAINCVLFSGARLLFLPRFDPEAVIRLLPRATVFMGVPTYYTRLLARPELNTRLCRGMRLFVSGSAPLLEETFQSFKKRTGHVILERYGMTETGMNTSNPLVGRRRSGTVGLPLPDVDVRVADTDGRPLGEGEIGVLEVRGPNVFKGYWRQPEKTAEEFRPDGFFITGDLARIDADDYVIIVGRSKDMIISGGLNVYPKEVESRLDDHPAVAESAVIGLPDADFGEAVVAIVQLRDGSAQVNEDTLIEGLKQELAGFKVPKKVFFVDELPRNAMGKVQKNTLRERFQTAPGNRP